MIPESPQSPNQVAIMLVGATPTTLLCNSVRSSVSHTNATPDTAMLTKQTEVPALYRPQVRAFKPNECLLRFLAYNVQKQTMLARFTRLMAKATKSCTLNAESTRYSERWYAKTTLKTMLATVKTAPMDPMIHTLTRLSMEI